MLGFLLSHWVLEWFFNMTIDNKRRGNLLKISIIGLMLPFNSMNPFIYSLIIFIVPVVLELHFYHMGIFTPSQN